MCLSDSSQEIKFKLHSNGVSKSETAKTAVFSFTSHELTVVQVQVHLLCASMINEREKAVAENQVAFRD